MMRYTPVLAALSASLFTFVTSTAHADQGFSIRYDEHMSKKSDQGGDFKDGSLAWQPEDGKVWSLGFRAASPPTARTLKGVEQKDTFRVYGAVSKRWALSPDTRVAYDLTVGQLNGFAVSMVRDSIDAVHRWEGIDDSRHSPLTTSSRALVQGTASVGTLLATERMGSQEWALTGVGSLNVGTAQVSGTLGVVASLTPAGLRNPLPNARMPGVADQPARNLGGYLGVFLQATGYDLETQYAQRAPAFTYARAGWSLGLTEKTWVQVEFSKDLNHRLQHQVTEAYPYLNLQLGARF